MQTTSNFSFPLKLGFCFKKFNSRRESSPTFGVTKRRAQSNSLNPFKTFKGRTGIQNVSELIEAHTMLPVADPREGPGERAASPYF